MNLKTVTTIICYLTHYLGFKICNKCNTFTNVCVVDACRILDLRHCAL